jgi:malate/lactate dehydrogenase
MPKISIIGAGDVAATVAYTLQLCGSATEIVLIDVNRERAEGHALDMNHGDGAGLIVNDLAFVMTRLPEYLKAFPRCRR